MELSVVVVVVVTVLVFLPSLRKLGVSMTTLTDNRLPLVCSGAVKARLSSALADSASLSITTRIR